MSETLELIKQIQTPNGFINEMKMTKGGHVTTPSYVFPFEERYIALQAPSLFTGGKPYFGVIVGLAVYSEALLTGKYRPILQTLPKVTGKSFTFFLAKPPQGRDYAGQPYCNVMATGWDDSGLIVTLPCGENGMKVELPLFTISNNFTPMLRGNSLQHRRDNGWFSCDGGHVDKMNFTYGHPQATTNHALPPM